MRVLLYNELDVHGLKVKIDKVIGFLEKGDFNAAQVKKLKPGAYYRAKLDETNRLLFRFGQFADEQVILVLETIRSHRYERSRFLGENKSLTEDDFNTADMQKENVLELKALPQEGREFRLLDKVICLDPSQSELMHQPLPMIIIGSAGSGKTALILEKMRALTGDILYLSLSPFLVENCRKVYHAHSYVNESQNIDFLSLKELIGTIAIPDLREIDFHQFSAWFQRYKTQAKDADSYQVFEEFRGVITGLADGRAFLSHDEYRALGPKQSLFPESSRTKIYGMFEEYRKFLDKAGLYDPNLLAFRYLGLSEARYDAIVIDEVQDFTSVQILLAMKLLRKKGNFIFSGDSNQVVHPNFFSWSKIKSMFYDVDLLNGRDILRILSRNYRCASCITDLANKLLRVKQVRFGSIDKESHYLIESLPSSKGSVSFLSHKDKVLLDLNNKTKLSSKHAVIVLDDSDKDKARKYFQTPLVFSVREAKGLEYENIILYNIVSDNRQAFAEITTGIIPADLLGDFVFGRNKDKSDRSAESYKYFINGLYVALSRAMRQIYWVESDEHHSLLGLLDFKVEAVTAEVTESKSSLEEWQMEARRLEQQGRFEQADEIRRSILQNEPVPWAILDSKGLDTWISSALHPVSVNKEAQRKLYSVALHYQSGNMKKALVKSRFGLAGETDIKGLEFVNSRYYKHFSEPGWHVLKSFIRRHGVDFRNEFAETPLMVAAREGNIGLIGLLLDSGADASLRDMFGLLPVQLLMMELFAGRRFDESTFCEVFNRLAPQALTFRAGNRLVKLDRRLIEYLLLLSAAPFIAIQSQKSLNLLPVCYTTGSILDMLGCLPEALFPEKRRKRSYISAALSRNEKQRVGPYNREIFFRIKTGSYILSPWIAWPKDDSWEDFYSSLSMDNLIKLAPKSFGESFAYVMQQIQENFGAVQEGLEPSSQVSR